MLLGWDIFSSSYSQPATVSLPEVGNASFFHSPRVLLVFHLRPRGGTCEQLIRRGAHVNCVYVPPTSGPGASKSGKKQGEYRTSRHPEVSKCRTFWYVRLIAIDISYLLLTAGGSKAEKARATGLGVDGRLMTLHTLSYTVTGEIYRAGW